MAGKKLPDYLKENSDGTVAITLARPAEVNGARLSVLTMREPTVEDQLTADETSGSDGLKEITQFANLCQIAPDDVRKLTLRNYKRLQGAFTFFIE